MTYESPAESVEAIIQKVDTLMYDVKHSGKDNLRHEVVGMDQAAS